MRFQGWVLSLAGIGMAAAGVVGGVPAAMAQPAASFAGSWQGPFLDSNFTFEFRQSGTGWAGRYRSDKSGKWADLQGVSVTDGVLRFAFVSQPPSTFALRLAGAGKTLTGTATFGAHPALPMTLSRAS